jgi:hypothetical protein
MIINDGVMVTCGDYESLSSVIQIGPCPRQHPHTSHLQYIQHIISKMQEFFSLTIPSCKEKLRKMKRSCENCEKEGLQLEWQWQ